MQDPCIAALRERLRAAEEAIRARDDFLAIAAHELRSPLNALALRLAALERMAAGSDARLASELQRARRSVDRYVRRAVVLLDVNRLQADAPPLQVARVSLARVVRDVVEAHRDEAAFCGASLALQVDADCEGEWDEHMIEQIATNLVSNAIKYGNGTPVQVRAGPCGPAHACLEVADQGPGIDEAHRQRIFDKFERVVSTARDRAGFGLGLWIVGRMVAAHGGAIEVGTAPGGGALFRVVLPLQPATQQQEWESFT
jgi:signal transduction histidine kinase